LVFKLYRVSFVRPAFSSRHRLQGADSAAADGEYTASEAVAVGPAMAVVERYCWMYRLGGLLGLHQYFFSQYSPRTSNKI